MLPDLTILLAILLGAFSLQGEAVDPLRSALGTLACVAITVGLIQMSARRGLRALERRELPQAALAARLVSIWPVLGWAAALHFFGWGALVADLLPPVWWLLRWAALYVPAAVVFAVAWAARGALEAEVARLRGHVPPVAGARDAIRQGLRRNGIALLPLVLLVGILEGVGVLADLGVPGFREAARWMGAMPLLVLGVLLVVLAAMSLFLPAIFRRLLATEPMPPGPLRSLLERFALTLRLRYREIVVWKTDGRVLNAMVVGFTPGTRTIFITDGLLRRLPTEELLAVFGHEAGHARRHHLPLFLVIFVSTAILFELAGGELAALGVSPFLLTGLHLAFLWFFLLGTVSRLFEREADVFGAEHAAALEPEPEAIEVPGLTEPLPEGAARMIRALERIERLTGRGTSHRHGTIQERVRFVAVHATDPQVRRSFLRLRRRLLGGVVGMAVLAIGALAIALPSHLALGRARMAFQEGVDAYREALQERRAGAAEAALPRWQEALARFEETLGAVQGRGGADTAILHAQAAFNAADTLLHGLRDEARAREAFRGVLADLESSDLPREVSATLSFHAHVELGRIAAHERDVQAAREHAVLAERSHGLLRTAADRKSEQPEYRRARLALLGAAIDARDGKPRSAREVLGRLALERREEDPWMELREDAALELASIPEGS